LTVRWLGTDPRASRPDDVRSVSGRDTEEVASMQRKGTFPPPFHSCISCFKGDTNTAVLLRGEAEWCAVALAHWADISTDDAMGILEFWAREEFGCDPGMVPAGRIDCGFRLCRACATRTGAHVSAPGELASVYEQPGARR
jgi:hypothetical protein